MIFAFSELADVNHPTIIEREGQRFRIVGIAMTTDNQYDVGYDAEPIPNSEDQDAIWRALRDAWDRGLSASYATEDPQEAIAHALQSIATAFGWQAFHRR